METESHSAAADALASYEHLAARRADQQASPLPLSPLIRPGASSVCAYFNGRQCMAGCNRSGHCLPAA